MCEYTVRCLYTYTIYCIQIIIISIDVFCNALNYLHAQLLIWIWNIQ